MGRHWFIVMHDDASLHIIPGDDYMALHDGADPNLFGPYGSYDEAVSSAENADIEMFYIFSKFL